MPARVANHTTMVRKTSPAAVSLTRASHSRIVTAATPSVARNQRRIVNQLNRRLIVRVSACPMFCLILNDSPGKKDEDARQNSGDRRRAANHAGFAGRTFSTGL